MPLSVKLFEFLERGDTGTAKLLCDSVDQVIETCGHLMPENLADAVVMIDRKLGRDEPAAMRAEIQRLREELQLAKAA